MLPLRDVNPPARTPLVTYALVLVNTAVFAYEASLGTHVERFITDWGMVPATFTPAHLFSSMFLHGGLAHLFGNMWFLSIFGDNVEDRFGRARFLLFYLVCGAVAGLAQWVVDPTSNTPVVGASGAIAGVTGAYLLMFPHAKVRALAPFFFVTEMPAYIFLLFWLLIQVQGGCSSSQGATTGVAFFAHIGGFLAGAVLALGLTRFAPLTQRHDSRNDWV